MRLARVVALAISLSLSACGSSAKPPSAPSPEDDAASIAPPQGRGTKRALVLVDDDAKPSAPKERVEDQYSTRRIVEKVTAP